MTVLTEKQQLREAVVANRRMLMLLDRQIEELSGLNSDVAESEDPDRHKPFSYIVEGVDKKAGILVPPFVQADPLDRGPIGFQNPYYGYIRMQSDAAFVATQIFVCGLVSQGEVGPPRLKHVSAVTLDATFSVSFRLYDESAGRWLFLTNSQQRVQQDTAVPAPVLGPLPIASAGGLELSTECMFPRNGLLRVEAYIHHRTTFPLSIYTDIKRIFFTLHGYKVFGA